MNSSNILISLEVHATLSNQLEVMKLQALLNKSEILQLNLEDQNAKRKFLLVSKIMCCSMSRNLYRRGKYCII